MCTPLKLLHVPLGGAAVSLGCDSRALSSQHPLAVPFVATCGLLWHRHALPCPINPLPRRSHLSRLWSNDMLVFSVSMHHAIAGGVICCCAPSRTDEALPMVVESWIPIMQTTLTVFLVEGYAEIRCCA